METKKRRRMKTKLRVKLREETGGKVAFHSRVLFPSTVGLVEIPHNSKINC